jgi:YidC/Oxa1 family membrane protein insertase
MSAKGFDKNSIIGLVLIGAILLIFSVITQPTEEEIKAKEEKDKQIAKTEKAAKIKDTAKIISPEIDTNNITSENNLSSDVSPIQDSISKQNSKESFGNFSAALNGEEKEYVIENEKIKVSISNKGGRVSSVELKGFHTYDSLPLILFHKDSSEFYVDFIMNDGISGNKEIKTDSLYFETENQSFKVSDKSSKSLSMKLFYGSPDKYIEYKYTLAGNSYTVDFELNTVGLNTIIPKGFNYLLHWSMSTPNQEKTIKNQGNISTIYYQYSNKEWDYISPMSYEKESMITEVEWIMFKQQYFNSTLIAKDKPFNSDSDIETINIPEGTSENYVQGMSANIAIPYNGAKNESFAMQYYFGPNKYEELKEIGVGIENSIDFGWPVIKQVNKYVIRNVFTFLNNTGMNIGLTILLLTLIIKTILFPITWKTYLSSAKMKVLKPEIAELTEKFKNDAVKKQQATMALYRQTGVNPLAGCIPMLIQMPILFALFRFFPATFDLRQKSFLWAEDLSTYDSIYELGFNIPMYGDHISLFTLLMAISMIFYTKVNSQMTSGMGGDNNMMASQMKIMTYLMPVMMLVFFNSYAAGLSFYYLIANVITIFQQYAIKKWFVDEDKLHAKIQANKSKKKKKSGFSAKLEQRMKEAQEMQKKRKKK